MSEIKCLTCDEQGCQATAWSSSQYNLGPAQLLARDQLEISNQSAQDLTLGVSVAASDYPAALSQVIRASLTETTASGSARLWDEATLTQLATSRPPLTVPAGETLSLLLTWTHAKIDYLTGQRISGKQLVYNWLLTVTMPDPPPAPTEPGETEDPPGETTPEASGSGQTNPDPRTPEASQSGQVEPDLPEASGSGQLQPADPEASQSGQVTPGTTESTDKQEQTDQKQGNDSAQTETKPGSTTGLLNDSTESNNSNSENSSDNSSQLIEVAVNLRAADNGDSRLVVAADDAARATSNQRSTSGRTSTKTATMVTSETGTTANPVVLPGLPATTVTGESETDQTATPRPQVLGASSMVVTTTSGWRVAGVIGGGLLVLALAGWCLWWWLGRRERETEEEN